MKEKINVYRELVEKNKANHPLIAKKYEEKIAWEEFKEKRGRKA